MKKLTTAERRRSMARYVEKFASFIHKELDAQMTQIQSRKQELLAIGHEVTE